MRQFLELIIRNWQSIAFAASVDAIFIWTFVFSIGDRSFQFVDLAFIAQIQLRLLGVFVLSWSISVMLSSLIRSGLLYFRSAFLGKRIFRRYYRFMFRTFALEILIAAVLGASSLVENLQVWLLVGLGPVVLVELLSALSKSLGFSKALPSRLDRRYEEKRKRSTDELVGLQQSIALLGRNLEQLQVTKVFLLRALCVIITIGLADSHADKFKSQPKVLLHVADRQIVGSIVGQTGYGLLVWKNACKCLYIAGFGQLGSIEDASEQRLAIGN